MKNSKTVWILYVIALCLNWLMAEDVAKDSKSYLIIDAAGLPNIYFENALTSKFNSKGMFLWRRGFPFVSTGYRKLWIYSWLRKNRFDKRRPPKEFPIEADGPDDPTFQRTSVEVSSEFYI